MRLMDSVSDEDYDIADEAEEDLHYLGLGPFDSIFDKIEPTFINQRHYTL